MSNTMTAEIELTVNGTRVSRTVDCRKHLVDFLREDLGLTGSHLGCEHGVCGACTVRLDGRIVRGCLVLAARANGCRVETSENPEPDPVLKALQEAGRLVLAGPHPAIDSPEPGPAGFTGSLVVAEFASREAAIAWAAEDPYVAAGVYRKVTVKPFRKALPQ